ncbi:ABC transporter substrate-binding protein [uncultured Megasphaera sp.]|uniref:ABC transporter substrate-binding protein n=1 Tax=uncultured Megasphaera sp. TaxID=165188 RepID=UPI00265A90F1|nr:ABC transporter substrate-binding protein [uncultured Megasphaera sp.]
MNRTFSVLKRLGCAALVCCMLVLAGCGGNTAGGDARDGKVLTYASPDYTTINSLLNTHDELPNIIFSGLMTYDAKGNPIPDLAESYEFNQDTLTYTFHLRDGVTWHDGQPFTAADVKFTLDTLTHNKDLEASITDNYKEIQSVATPDDKTVIITLSAPNAAMLNYLTIGILPKHLLEGKDIMTDSFNQHPVGTGRYQFVSWDKGQSIIVKKNPKFYGKMPKIDEIIFKIIPDENAKAAQVKSGGVDLAWLNAQNAASFRNDSKFAVYDFKTADYRAIAPNFKVPFWQKHRELIPLLGYALDKQAIIDSVLQGQGEVAYSPLQINKEYNDPNVEQRAYNPELFKQKIEALGWKLGSDGIYEKDGEKLAFSVDTREYEEERVDIANIASSQFKKVGVQMDVHIVPKLDWKTLQSFLIGQAAPFDPDNGTYDLFYTGASGNYTGYSNGAVDQALAAARSSYDPAVRKAAYNQFQQAWAQDPAYIMVAYLDGNYVANKKLTGLSTERVLGHHAVGVMWNIEDWDIQ